MTLQERVLGYRVEKIFVPKHEEQNYGDSSDGVIEFPALTQDAGVIEVGYYYGDDKPKSIIGISPQIGCPSKCSFCELGEEPFKRNLTPTEMYEQVILMLQTVNTFGVDIEEKQHKVSVAKTGEPSFNPHLVGGLEKISELGFSFKVSTVFPWATSCMENLKSVAHFAAQYEESVQIQISLLSTSEQERRNTAGIRLAPFAKVREFGEYWKNTVPHGRDINLSIIVSEETQCRVEDVCDILTPDIFRFRFRNYVPTVNGADKGLAEVDTTLLEETKGRFRDKGYIVTDFPTPTPTEWAHLLAANVTRRRYIDKKRAEGDSE